MATYSNSQLRQRIDTKANWENTNTGNPVLASGEMALVTEMNSSDLTNQDFKIGNGSSNFNNLPYVIANNKEVKTAKTTAQNASTAASNASQAASAASITASTSLGKLKQLVCENYATSANLFNEMLTKENQNTAKKAALDEWGKYVTSEAQPTYRVTDAVSFDALFLFMYAMAKAGIINNIDQTTMNNFLNYLETAFGAYANTKDTKNRQELDAARVEWLNELG